MTNRLDPGAARALPEYDVLPGGQRFVMVQTGGGQQIHVALNWSEELEAASEELTITRPAAGSAAGPQAA